MGNHSTKRPIAHNPSAKQVRTLPVVDVPTGETTVGYAEGIPFGNVHRIVARYRLKDRIAVLENIIKQHQPLVKAMQVTQKAYQEGVMEGIRQVAAAEREKEATAALVVPDVQPCQEEREPTGNQAE